MFGNFSRDVVFFNTSGGKHLGRYCYNMPKGAFTSQFHSGLPTSSKGAKPKGFNQDGRVTLIQYFVNAL